MLRNEGSVKIIMAKTGEKLGFFRLWRGGE